MFKNAEIVSTGVNPETYHGALNAARGDKARIMGRSDLMSFDLCPSRWLAGYESKETHSTEWGSLIDTLVLSTSEIDNRYAITPDTYPDTKTGEPKPWNWNATHCKSWRAQQGAKTCIRPDDYEGGKLAVEKLMACEPVNRLLSDAINQVHVSGEYHDKSTGLVIRVKILIDAVPHGKQFKNCLTDLKTSLTASGLRWARICFDRGYHVQAAFYLDLYNAATGEERTDWLHIVQENFHPYEVALPLPLLSQEFINLGRVQYKQALRDYCQCLTTGHWPSYAPTELVIGDFQIIDPEPWMVGVKSAFRSIAPEIESRTEHVSDPNDLIP